MKHRAIAPSTITMDPMGAGEGSRRGERIALAQLSLPVAETFVSINGEGPFAGHLASFIRLAGCNLDCSYCDTHWARTVDGVAEIRTIAELVDFIRQSPAFFVTLTGGEPLLHRNLLPLIEAIFELSPYLHPTAENCDHRPAAETRGVRGDGGLTANLTVPPNETMDAVDNQRDALISTLSPLTSPSGVTGGCYTVEVETNGSQDLGPLAMWRSRAQARGHHRLCFTMDYKLPSSGMEAAMRPDNFRHLGPCDSLKFVVGNEADLETMLRVIDEYRLAGRCQLFVSCVWGSMEPAQVVDFLKERRCSHIRLQLQLHKYIWPPDTRGV